MARTAAFFDIDGTISRTGLIAQMFKKMIKFELIDESYWFTDVKPSFSKWSKRMGSYDDYLMKMVNIYNKSLKDVQPSQIEHIARRVIEQQGDYVYVFTRDRIRMHKEKGHMIIAVSGSPQELVARMAKKFGMDDYRGTVFPVGEDGCYTGDCIPMWDSDSKRGAILDLAERHDIDLSSSFSYGDTSGDRSMLKLVGNPYAINPTRELIKAIKEDSELHQKTKIIVERKDVIYHLHVDNISFTD